MESCMPVSRNSAPQGRILISLVLAVAGVMFIAPILHALESIDYVEELKAQLLDPVDVAMDADNRVVTLDKTLGAINIYSPTGELVLSFSDKGSKPGQLRNPQALAITPAGNVAVADTGNDRIQVFSLSGQLLFYFGDHGSKTGQFSYPSGVAVDQAGYIYVADNGNKRLQSFSETGVYIGTLPLDFAPDDVALDSQRNIYLLSAKEGKIVKYSPKGERINEFTCRLNGKNYLTSASGMTVDQNGHIYFTELKEHSVKKIDESEVLRLSFGSEGEGRGQFQSPRGLAVLPSGQLYVADAENGRVQILQVKGIMDKPLNPITNIPDLVDFEKEIAFNPALIDIAFVKNHGLFTLSDKEANVIRDGESRQVFGQRGKMPGQFRDPVALNVVRDGRIFVADTGNDRVQILNADGTLNYEFGKSGDKPGYFKNPEGIVVSRKGNIYVADSSNDRVQIFTGDGIFLKSFGRTSKTLKNGSPEPGNFRDPRALAINSQSQIFVVDYGNDRIQIFDEDGGFIRQFGSRGSRAGQFDKPADITIDENDFIYVADSGNNRVQIFNPEDKFVVAFGSYGTGPGYFPELSGIAAFEGKIYVSDYRLDSVKVFTFNRKAVIGKGVNSQQILADLSSVAPENATSKERIYVTKIFHLPTDYSGDNNSLNEQVRQLTRSEALNELAHKLGVTSDILEPHIKVETEDLTENGQYKMTISAPQKIQ